MVGTSAMRPLLSIGGFLEWVPLDRTVKPRALFDQLGEEREEKLREEFCRWLLQLLKAQVLECIRLQRFPVDYEPLSPAWSDRKQRLGLNPGFWTATGTLAESLSVWKQRGEKVWHLGWRANQLNPMNGQPIAVIAEALELGAPERNLPARPLFTVLAGRLQRSTYRLFYRFCGEKHPSYLAMLPRP